MRCPKCGYISFDHLEKCRKCNKNIETISAGLFGSTYNIAAPTFLKLTGEQREDSFGQMDLSEERSFDIDDDYIDEELAVLVEEEVADEEGEINFAKDAPAGMALADEDELDDGEIEIDFSQFEETDQQADLPGNVGSQQGQVKQHDLKADMPAALSDISDLARPAKNTKKDASLSESPADKDLSDFNLDDLNFDLGLDGLDDTAQQSPTTPEKGVLSLDELDFADALAGNDPEPAKKTDDLDLDLELDFNLDLGGLSIHKDA